MDAFAKASNVFFSTQRYGDVAELRLKNQQLILLKPSTYMNLSGEAVRYWKTKENIDTDHILIVVDDIALPFGAIRMKAKGADGGHNGLKNIAALLQTPNFPRLRFGVGNDFPKGGQIDFVLGKFPPEERAKMPEVLKRAAEAVSTFCLAGPDIAMNRFNH